MPVQFVAHFETSGTGDLRGCQAVVWYARIARLANQEEAVMWSVPNLESLVC